MSLTSKQIDELRAYAKDRKGELAKLINDAADTIEILSAKLHASQMERSSQYYHGGWIPVSERLPDKEGNYLITAQPTYNHAKDIRIAHWAGRWAGYVKSEIIAWMPLPEPYMEEQDAKMSV